MPLPNTFGAASARGFGGFNFQTPRDPNFSSVSLLLPGNGTNGAQNNTFLDSSANNFTITRNGNTTQGTFSPFSQTGWSNYFSSGGYLSGPSNSAFAVGTGDFTLEFWTFLNAVNVNQCFYDASLAGQPAARNDAFTVGMNTSGQLYFYTASTTNIASAAPQINTWAHIAVSRSGTSLRMFLNGVQVLSLTNSTDFSRTGYLISTITESLGGYTVNGHISNLRLVKGTALYTSAFTPPTTPLTAITNTSLLTCQSNRFIDNSTNNFTITRNGDVSVQAFSPFNPTAAWSAATNGGSGYFDGSGDYLGVADSTAFDLNTTFTVEGWFYQPTAGNGTIFARGGGSASWSTVDGHEYHALVFSGLFYWQFNSGGSAVSITAAAPAAGAWHHFAVGYNGTTTRVWLDGASIGTSTSGYTLPSSRGITRVGFTASSEHILTGYISGLRVVKGTDVYGVGNTSITVPTAPLTAITNTSLLLNFTNGAIYDAAAKNDLETVGNAQTSTTQSKWGGSSMYFDGTGDNLVTAAPSTVPFAFGTGDFTVECWAYFSVLSAANIIYDGRPLATNTTQPTIYVNSAGNLFYFANNANQIQAGASSVTTATWYHIAVARSGTSTRMFLNGVQVGSTYSDSTNYTNTSGRPVVGVDGSSGNTNYLNGYLQDLRITKGVARYTSNFTPPTAPFPVR